MENSYHLDRRARLRGCRALAGVLKSALRIYQLIHDLPTSLSFQGRIIP